MSQDALNRIIISDFVETTISLSKPFKNFNKTIESKSNETLELFFTFIFLVNNFFYKKR